MTMCDGLCSGGSCPLRKSCHRFTASPCGWQSYFGQAPMVDGECEYYWSNGKEKANEGSAVSAVSDKVSRKKRRG